MKPSKLFSSLLVLAAASATACNSTPVETEPTPHEDCHDADKAGCEIVSDKQRITNADVPDADQKLLTSGNSAFALDLYQELRSKPGNMFYSPFSISQALAMTWAGARKDTETAMAGTMHFDLPQGQLHPAFNWLDLELMSRGQGKQGADGNGFRLNVANALWGQIGYPVEQPFIDTLGQHYGAGMHIVDFEGDAQGSADVINGWVKDRTEGKIEKLIPVEAITSDTVMVLTNAIYFNAAWKTPFKDADTKDGTFTLVDGSTATAKMMHGNQEAPYSEGDDYKALVMPYDGDELSMVMVLPEQGSLDAFEASFDAAKLDAIVNSATTHSVDVTMPRFKFDYELSVKKALTSLGMGIAFENGKADFTGINSSGQPYIQDVLHKAFVGVNEAGTEAAAATAVIVGDESLPEFATISLDHAFLFFIRDNATGTLLFAGRVVDPS